MAPKQHSRLGAFHCARPTDAEEQIRREAAFTAIKQLYRESLPLWRVCRRGSCRRHKACAGDAGCLARGWPLMLPADQRAATVQVRLGGPRRVPPATDAELALRRFPPSNFVL